MYFRGPRLFTLNRNVAQRVVVVVVVKHWLYARPSCTI